MKHELIHSAMGYAREVMALPCLDGLGEKEKNRLSNAIIGSYLSGIGTICAAMSAFDGADFMTPQAIVKAVDEAALELGIGRATGASPR